MERLPARETSSPSDDVMGLTDRLLDFAPGIAGEQLTEKQEIALKEAAVYFYKQLMLQQQKPNDAASISLVNSSSDICRICREAGSKEDLITTCCCRGTMRFIHLSCLEHWLAESDSTKCELCSYQYQTVRTPKYSIIKSILLWLQNPGRRRDAREIMLDFLALIVFTPMAFFGTYMALLTAETWYIFYYLNFTLLRFKSTQYTTENCIAMSPTITKIVSVGCLGIIGAIDTAYFSWLLVRAQHHTRAWNRWRRRNSIVKVILSPKKSKSNEQNGLNGNKSITKAEDSVTNQVTETES
ncbi:membrane associated RING finger, putative [Pediculus humanus corporis]|uniref:Membrane associated RING finger, putative n=1 Tax=Pediculus humanus subsp. corporis TaxID=121224 RepID=E0VCX3_PEDHC|nr:membrane associated RING finger, putative [Pediculus humanus corporis]EEB11229.1 membrane associated RING finger, putative [Pediculus humanus corporis]